MSDINFSLIYPNYQELNINTYSDSNTAFFHQLEIDSILMITKKIGTNDSEKKISDYFTSDVDTIKYRLDTVDDILSIEPLRKALQQLLPMLEDISELRKNKENYSDVTTSLYCITEIELYTDCIDLLYNCFSKISSQVNSDAFKNFEKIVSDITQSSDFINMKQELSKMTKEIRGIRSITIGINLDAQLRPVESGLLSINSEVYKSGAILDKLLRLDLKNDRYTCIAPLIPFKKGLTNLQRTSFDFAFNSALDMYFKSSVNEWQNIIKRYVLNQTDFLLRLIPEIKFLVAGINLFNELYNKGMPLCKPEIFPMEDKKFSVYNFYNPLIALKSKENEIVFNDLDFDENGMIYILTGPNRGGKSVVVEAVGMIQALFQLGFYVPAKRAKLSPVDIICTHFPTGTEENINKGRFGEECQRINNIFDKISPYSLVLMDEAFSSTSSFEAAYIAEDILTGFSFSGCRCIFATHLHELAEKTEKLNDKNNGGSKIDNLVAGIEKNKERSFKISRSKPDGLSYARDIAEKHGLTLDNILNKIRSKK